MGDIRNVLKKIFRSIKTSAFFVYACVSVIVNLSSIGLITIGFPVYVTLFGISIVSLSSCLLFHFFVRDKISDMLKNNEITQDELDEIRTYIDEFDRRTNQNAPDNNSNYRGNRIAHTQIVDIVI